MQLNKTHKAEIVNKIMADIPQTKYGEVINGIVQAKAYELMPDEVKAVYDNEATRGFLSQRYCAVYGEHAGSVGYVYWGLNKTANDSLYLNRSHYNDADSALTKKLLAEVQVPVKECVRLAGEQGRALNSMREKLQTVLAGIRTLKQAKDMLEPELHKYLPVPPPKDSKPAQASTALVPYVVANLREMGWPK